MKKRSLSFLLVFVVFLFSHFNSFAGDQTIPFEPVTDQAVIDEAIFLVNQYGSLASNIDGWLDSDVLGELTGPVFGNIGTAIGTYQYAKEMKDVLACDEPGKPACDDAAARWMVIADKVGSLAVDKAKDWAIGKAQEYVVDTLLWQGASGTVGLVTAPAEMCYQVVKTVIDTADGNNIRNRMAFYVQFKEKFPSDMDSLPLMRVMNEHGDPRNVPGFTAEQEIFVVWYFGSGGYLSGRIVNESIDMVRNCYEPAKNLWEMKEYSSSLVSGFYPEEAAQQLADELIRIDQAKNAYAETPNSDKLRFTRAGDTLIVQNAGEEYIDSMYIKETSGRNSETAIAVFIAPGESHTFDLTPLGDDDPEEIVFKLFGLEFTRPLSDFRYQDVLPEIEITDVSNDGVIPVTIQANADQTVLADGLTASYSWEISRGSETLSFSGSTLSHTFEERGTYEITLTATAGGKDYSVTKDFTAETDPAMRPVIQSFTVSNEMPDKGEMLHLEADVTDPFGMGLEYIWRETEHFSGESEVIGTGASADVVFSGGYREYRLQVSNPHGSDYDEVSVMEAGEWNIKATGADWIGETTLTFTAVGGNALGATFEWLFSDGGSGSGESADHYFAGGGDYTATLRVHKNGSVTEVTKEIHLVNENEIPWQVGEPDSANITGKGADYLTVSLNPPSGSYSQVLVVARAAGEPAWTPENGVTYSEKAWVGDGQDRLGGIGSSMTSATANGLNKIGARWYLRVWYRYYDGGVYKYRMGDGGSGVTTLGGTINGDLTLDVSGSPYVLSSLTIASGGTLTIQSGVIIKNLGGIKVEGTLNAAGVVFTSLKDDSAGGDTNGDGNASFPQETDWKGIVFASGSAGIFDGCAIRYASSYAPVGGLYGQICILSDNVTIKNSIISKGESHGIMIKNASPTIQNNTLSNSKNGRGIYLVNSQAIIDGNRATANAISGICLENSPNASITNNRVYNNNTISYSSHEWQYKGIYVKSDSVDAYFSNNIGTDLIFVDGSCTFTAERIWDSSQPWVLQKMIIDQNGKLSIEPGTIVKLTGEIIVDGELNATGGIFTSYADDACGGDTNLDGNESDPLSNCQYRGYGIFYKPNSKGILDNCSIKYLCSPTDASGSIEVQSDHITVKNCILQNTLRGISVENAAPVIIDNIVTGCSSPGITLKNAQGSIITGNKSFGNRSWPFNVGIAVYDNSINSKIENNYGTNLIYVSGGIVSTDCKLDAAQPWLMYKDLSISKDGSLTVDEGAIIKTYDGDVIIVEGELNAKNAIFTSMNDDSVGGDTNNDEDQTSSPSDDDWSGITFLPGSRGLIDGCEIRYCDYGYSDFDYGHIGILSDNVIIKNCTIKDGVIPGIYIENASPEIHNCLISGLDPENTDNGTGIKMQNSGATVFGNTITGNSDYGIAIRDSNYATVIHNKVFDNGNNYRGISVNNSANSQIMFNEGTDFIRLCGGTISSSRHWDNSAPWVIACDLTISPSGKLSISTGAVVKSTGYNDIVVEGALNAQNAFFTSYKDDEIGGDTNGNGDSTTPAPGDWGSIVYKPGSSGTLNNVIVRYGDDTYVDGKSCYGQVSILSDDVTVKDCLIQSGDRAGIYVESALPELIHNRLFNNYYGLYNASSAYTVDASDNFWGDPTGPQHADNPGGLGDKVSNYVLFDPWQNSEYTIADAIITLQILTGIQTDYIPIEDMNTDNQIGLPETLYILQHIVNLRE